MFTHLKKSDPVLYKLMMAEINRQNLIINLIPSENIASLEILEAVGSSLMNKYSEGYPGSRYYPGNIFYDKIENLAQERALKLFGLNKKNWAVNVQPYSGSPANLAIYLGLLKPGDTILGMNLFAGGHLTHGHRVSFSGKLFKAIQYGIDSKTGLINFDEINNLVKKYQPKIIVSGATAYPRKIDFKKFGEIAKKAGTYHLADISHIAGLIASGLHASPFKYADIVMTTTHKTLRGPRGAIIFTKKVKTFHTSPPKADQPRAGGFMLHEAIDRAVFPGLQGGPHNNITAAKALCFYLAQKQSFKKYSKQIVKNAKILAAELIKHDFNLMSNGTDNHLLLIDLSNKDISGMAAEKKLEIAGILVNRNSIFGDQSPFKPSGIRMGTPYITSRGMKEKEMKQIARWIHEIIDLNRSSKQIKTRVEKICRKFPLLYK